MTEEPIKPVEVASIIGVTKKHLLPSMDTANVEVSTLAYDDGLDSFIASTPSGRSKTLYVVETPRGKRALFGNRRSMHHLIESPELHESSPDILDERATTVYIPGKFSDLQLRRD